MRISISNIAWDPTDDEAVAVLLNKYCVDAIDIAPGKYFPDVAVATSEDIALVRAAWERRGVALLGMQSLFFGRNGLNLFDRETQPAMLEHLANVCRLAECLGVRALVFGSPKCRDRGQLEQTAVDDISADFFSRAGDIAARHGTVLCLEANPPQYGCNFMTTTLEAAYVVRCVAHPAVRLHLDTGTLTINQESLSETLHQCGDLVGYAHASEPNLAPLGSVMTDHDTFARAMRLAGLHTISIEMLTPVDRRLAAIERALQVATQYYRAQA